MVKEVKQSCEVNAELLHEANLQELTGEVLTLRANTSANAVSYRISRLSRMKSSLIPQYSMRRQPHSQAKLSVKQMYLHNETLMNR